MINCNKEKREVVKTKYLYIGEENDEENEGKKQKKKKEKEEVNNTSVARAH